MNVRRYSLAVIVLGALAMLGTQPLSAAVYWGGDSDFNWTTAGNWFSDIGHTTLNGAAPTINDDVYFNANGVIPISIQWLNGAVAAKSLHFNSNASSGITINFWAGETLTIGSGGIVVDAASGGAHNLNCDIFLQTGQTWSNASGQPLTIGGSVDTQGFGLIMSGAGDFSLTGSILASSAGTLTKSGGGMLKLNNSLGTAVDVATTVSGGTVQFQWSNQIGSTRTVTVDSGTLDLNGWSNILGGLIVKNGGTVSGTGSTIAIDTGGGSTPFDMQFGSVSASLAGSQALVKTTAGTVTLSGPNTYSGDTTIKAGTLSINALGALGTAATAIALGDTSTQGTLTYTGGAASLARGLTIAAGGGRVNAGAGPLTLGAAITGSGALTTSGTLTVSAANTGFSGPLTVAGGALTFTASNNLGDASVTNTLGLSGGGVLSYGGGAALDLGVNRAVSVGAGGGGVTTNAQALTVSGNIGGAGLLAVISGGGVVTFSGNNSGFSGAVSVDSASTTTPGILRLSNTSSSTANLGTSTGVTLYNTNCNPAGGNGTTLDLGDGVTVSGVPLTMYSSNVGGNYRSSLTTSGNATWAGNIVLNGNNRDQFVSNTAGKTLTIIGDISGALVGDWSPRGAGNGMITGTINVPAGNLAKTDAGTWTINPGTSGNTWGNTAVQVGTLKLGGANVLPAATILTMGQADTASPILDLNGFSQTVAGVTLVTTGGTKTITSLTGTPAILTINNSSAYDYGGVIAGTGLGLTKSGSATQTLSGANTYTGTTTVSSGTLQIGAGAAAGTLGTGGVNLTSTGTLTFFRNDTAAITVANNIWGSGPINLNGTGTSLQSPYAFTGNNIAYSGNWTLTSSRLAASNAAGNVIGTGPVTMSGASAAFLTGGVFNNAFNIAGNGWWETTGDGYLGAMRLEGNTNVAGTVTLIGNTRISTFGANGMISGVVAGIFNIEKKYPNTLTLRNTANTFSGRLAIDDGVVAVMSLGDAGAGSNGTGTITLGLAAAATTGQLTYLGTGSTTARGVDLAGTTVGGILDSSGFGPLVINGNVTSSGATAAKTLTLQGNNTTANTLGGIISDGAFATAVTKTGTGTWLLNGGNTFLGAMTVSNGVLQLGGTNLTQTVNVNAGSLRLGAAGAISSTAAVAVNATGAGVSAMLDLNGFNQTLNNLTLGGTTTTSTPMMNTGTGAGTLTLGGSLTYTGTTNNPLGAVITGAGGISLGGATRTFTINDSTSTNIETIIYAPIMGGGAAGGLTKAGATSVLYLANTAASDLVNSNTVTVNTATGTLAVGVGVGGGSNAIGTATVALAGGTLRYAPNIYSVVGETPGFATAFYNNGAGNPNTLDFATLSNLFPIGARTGVDTQINAGNVPGNCFNIVPPVQGMNHANIAATWNGLLNITTGGTYAFNDWSDDGSFLYIDGNLIVGGTGVVNSTVSTYLTAGKHTISYRFAQGAGGVYAAVSYQGPDTNGAMRVINSAPTGVITNAPVSMTVNNPMTLSVSSTLEIGADTTNNGALTVSAGGQTLTVNSVLGSFTYTQAGNVTLPGAATTTFTTSAGTGANVNISGNIGEAAATAALTKSGFGVLTLSGDNSLANSYSGTTSVTGGVLRLNNQNALGAGNLTLNGGVLELQDPNAISLLTGATPGRMQITGGQSGFSAYGGTATVNLNPGLGVTWGSATFAPAQLVLNYTTANAPLVFMSDLDLGGTTRTVRVLADPSYYLGANWAASPAPDTITGAIASAANGLTKDGGGVLVLAPAEGKANTYPGTTTVSAGVLRIKDNSTAGSALFTGNLSLNGGVLELQNPLTFTRATGAGLSQVQLAGVSGFSAFGGPATVNLGGGAALTWTASNFNPGTFVLNYYSADSTIDFQNAVSLNAGTRTVAVYTTAAGPAATMSGQITGTGASNLVKTGLGTLILSNPANTYAGSTTVNQGTLRLGATGALPSGTALTVSGNSTGMVPVFDLSGSNATVASVTLGGAFLSDSGAITTGTGVLTTNGNVTFDATNNPVGATITGATGGGIKMGLGTVQFAVGDSTSAAVDLTVAAPVDGNAFGFTKTGAGTMALAGTTGGISNISSLSFTTTLIDGDPATPANNNGVTDRIANTVGLSLSGTTFTMAFPAAGTHAQSLASITFAGVGNTINTTNTPAGTLNLTFTGPGASVYNRGAAAFINFAQDSANFSFTSAPSTNVAGGILQGAVLDGRDVILAQSGTLTAPAYATNTWDPINGTNVTANNAPGAGSTTLALRFDPSGTGSMVTLNGTNTISSGAIVAGARLGIDRGITLTGGTVRSGATEMWVYNDTPAGIDSTIADSTGGPTTLVKGGSGRLVLTQNNSYTGATTISAGTLQLGNYTSAGSYAGGLVNNTATAVAVLTNRSNVTLAGPITGTTPTISNIGVGTVTLTGLSSGTTVTAAGSGLFVLDGTVTPNIVKATTGNMTITGTVNGTLLLNTNSGNTYLGSAAVLNGNVTLGTAGTGTTLMLHAGAANQFNSAGTLTFNATTANWSYLKLMGFSQDIGTLAGTGVAGAVIENTEGERATRNSVLTLTNAGTINYLGYLRDINNGYASNDTGTIGLIKQGAGNLIIDPTTGTGRILFTGPTTISGGTLTILNQPGWGSQITDNAALTLDYTAATGTGMSSAIKGIGGSGTVTKANSGTAWIAGASTYTGNTSVTGGTLRADDGQGLPSGGTTGTLTLNPGVWEMGANTNRVLGNAAGQVQLTGGRSGFSAYAANATVNFGGAAAGIAWGQATFAPTTLVLNDANITATTAPTYSAVNAITLANAIDLNNTAGAVTRTVEVSPTAAFISTATGTLSGALTTTSGTGTTTLSKTGIGTLVLSNAGNAWAGTLDVQNGMVSVSALGDAVNGSTTINLGNLLNTGGLQYTGTASVVLSSRGINMAGTTGGAIIDASQLAGTTLTLNTAFSVPGAGAKTLTLQGSNTDANTISTAIPDNSVANYTSLAKAGPGTWYLEGANTYTGTTTINGGTLVLDVNGVIFAGATARAITFNQSPFYASAGVYVPSTLTISNTSAFNSGARVPDSYPVSMNGGTLNFLNDAAATTVYAETIGAVTLTGGYNVINAGQAAADGTSTLTLTSLTRTQGTHTGTLNFTGAGLGLTTRNTIVINGTVPSSGTIMGGAYTAGNEWAKYVAAGTISVTPCVAGDYSTNPAEGAYLTGVNVKATTGTITLGGARVINSYNVQPTAATTLAIGANSLRIESGGILVSGGGFATTISSTTGTLTAGSAAATAGDLIIWQNSTGAAGSDFTISAIIANNGAGIVNVIKTGTPGVVGAGANNVILSGANTYTGVTIVESGKMKIGHNTALGTVAGVTTVLPGAALEVYNGLTAMAEPLTLNGLGIANSGALRNTAGSNNLTGAITLGSDTRINADGGTTLFLGNATTASTLSMGAYNLTIGTLTSGGNGVVNIYDVVSGSGVLTKDGGYAAYLFGTNTYTGPTLVNEGYLVTRNASALGASSQVIVASGASLQLERNAANADYTISRPLIINGNGTTGTNGALRQISGVNITWNGTVTLGSDSRIVSDGNNLTLSGQQAIVGSGKNLTLGGAGAIFATGQVILGTGSLTKVDAGTVYLDGVNDWTGGTTVNAGYLRIRRIEALGGSGRDALVNSGGVLAADYANATVGTVQGMSQRVATGSAGSFIYYGGATNAISTNLAENIDLSVSGGTNAYFGMWSNGESANGNALAGPNAFLTGTLTPNGSTYKLANVQTWAMTGINALTGANSLNVGDVNTAGGAVFVTNKQNFSGGVTINRNSLVVADIANGGSDSGLGNATSNVAFSSTIANSQLVYIGSQNATTDRGITMYQDSNIDLQGLGNLTITGNLDPQQATSKWLYLRANTFPGVTGTITGSINDKTPGTIKSGISKDQGYGTWVISGTNNFSDGARVGAGVLQFDSAAAMGGTAIRDVTANAGGTVALNFVGAATALSGRVLNTSAGTVAVTPTSAAETMDFSTATGANMTAASLGAVGDVTYTGTHTPYAAAATAATWRLGGGFGTLRFSQVMGNTGLAATNVSPVAYFGNGSAGTVDLTGNATGNTYTGATTINGVNGAFLDQGTSMAGTVVVDKENLLGANPPAFNAAQLTLNNGILRTTASFNIQDANRGITLTNTGWFNVDQGTILGINNPIAGAGRLAKIGQGTLTLNNTTAFPNSSTGDVVVYTGAVKLGASEQIFNSTTVRVFGTLDLNGQTETINGLYGLGTVTNSSGSAATLVVGANNATNTAQAQFVGKIQETSGVINLTKMGTGTLNIRGNANTFTGQLWSQLGSVQIDSIGDSGAGSNGTGTIKLGYFGGAGGLQWIGNNGSTTRTIDLAGDAGNGILDASGNGPVSFTGGVTASGSGTKSVQLQGSYAGPYNGSATWGNNVVGGNMVDSTGAATGLYKTGPGMWVLTGTKNYTGGTVINQGCLAIDGDAALGASSSPVWAVTNDVFLQLRGNTTFTRNIYTNTGGKFLTIDTNGYDATFGDATNNTVWIGGAGKMRKYGAGTLTLSGARSNLWGDGMDVNGGRLLVDYANLATNLLPTTAGTTGAIGMNGGTLEFKANSSATTIQSLGALYTGTGESNVILNLNGTPSATIAFTNFNARTAGSAVNFNVTGAGTGSITTTQANNTWGIFGGYMTYGGTTWAYGTGSGNGPFTIAGLPDGAYSTTIVPGANVDVPASGLTATGTGTYTVSTLRFNAAAGGSLTLPSGLQMNLGDASHLAGAILVTPNVTGGPVVINGPGIIAGYGETILTNNSTTQDLIINAVIGGNQPLTKAGPGRLVLTGANAYGSQATYVNQGTILVTGAGVLGSTGGAINIGYSAVTSPPVGFATPTVTIDSAAALVQTNDSIRVGVNGVGVFNQSAGTVYSTTWVEIANALNSVGTYNMSGGTMNAAVTTAGGLIVGNTGAGTFNLSGGEVNIYSNGMLQMVRTQGGSGTVNQSGGTVNMYGTGNMLIGDQGPAVYNQNGGQVNVGLVGGGQTVGTGYVRLGYSFAGTGAYNLNGGTLTTNGIYAGGTQVYVPTGNLFRLGGGTLKAGANLDVTVPVAIDAGTSTINTNGKNVNLWYAATPTSNSGSLVKAGAGNLNLPNANAYTGGTTINAGKVIATGTSLGTGVVTVGPSGTLSLQDSMAGLKGEYYHSTLAGTGYNQEYALASEANFNAVFGNKTPNLLASTAAGDAANFDMGAGGANFPMPYNGGTDNAGWLTARYTGKFNAPTTGNYLFYTASDDNNMLFVDGKTVVYSNYGQGVVQRYGSIYLTAGQHDITTLFGNVTGGYGLYVDVAVPGEGMKRLPNSMLSFEAGGDATIKGLGGSGTVTLGSRTLTISDGAAQDFSGGISGAGAVVKGGGGTQTLSGGASTYSGGTTVSGGTLVVANTAGSATGSGSVTVNAGTLASGATGSIAGSLLAGSGAHSISPGGDGGIGSLGVGALTLNSNSSLRFDIASLAVLDQINDGSTLAFSGLGAANVLVPGGITTAGTYQLVDFGSTTASLGNFSLGLIGGGPVPANYSLSLTGNALDLLIASLGPVDATWAINTDGRWTLPANWTPGVPSGAGTTARFTGNAQFAVNVNSPQTVGRVLLTSSTGYTISGSALTLNNTGGTGGNAVISATAGSHTIASQVITAATNLDVSATLGGSLSLSGGVDNSAGLILSLTQSGTGSLSTGNIDNAGTLNITGTVASAVVSDSVGVGLTTIAAGGKLTADSLVQDVLIIGAGGSVSIRPTLAEAGAGGSDSVSQVPEPGTWVLLAAGAACLLPLLRRRRR